MDFAKVILCVSILTCLVSLFVSAGVPSPCQLAEGCECSTKSIVCEETGPADPIFTYYERALVEVLELSQNQFKFLEKVCRLFPSLDTVNLESDACPREAVRECARLRCT